MGFWLSEVTTLYLSRSASFAAPSPAKSKRIVSDRFTRCPFLQCSCAVAPPAHPPSSDSPFAKGTDLSLARVGPFKGTAFLVGAVQFTGLAAAGLGITHGLDYARTDALYLGLALAASSTIVGVRLLQRRQQMFEPFGRTVPGVLFGFMGTAAWLNVPLFAAALFTGAVLGGGRCVHGLVPADAIDGAKQADVFEPVISPFS